jgi:malate dehydrogenase (quinone)
MRYSAAFDEVLKWMPLVMKDRDHQQPLAATRTLLGTDVNFGTLTRCLFNRLKELDNVTLHFNHEVRSLHQDEHGYWHVKVKNTTTGEKKDAIATFVFIGAGGGSLPLMLKSGIPEGKGYGGFPVSGQWLRCTNPELIAQHNGKVYGKAAIGSPPMSVPHLDTRFIKGKKELLFGPYAGFSMKFLKKGSVLDLMKSVRITNIWPMLSAGFHNIPLTRYLIDQVRQSDEDRLEALRHFVPDAQMKDWTLEIAGQRVQVIKKDEEEGGILEFGTEVVSAEDGSLAALLGASPGASTAVSIMIGLLSKSFPSKMESEAWKNKLKEMIPSFGESLGEDPELCRKIREWSGRILNLKIPQPVE